MARPLHIACLQTRPMAAFDAAIAEAMPLAREAVEGGAEVLFLPEYCGGLRSEGAALTPPSEPEAMHPVLAAFREFAASRQVWILLGSIAVDGPEGRILNRGYWLAPDGAVAGRYDKIHLFDIQLSETEAYRESATVTPGGRAVVHEGAGTKIGHTICYDLRFAHLYRHLAQAGAEILTCPAAFTRKTGAAHWHLLNRARAIETTRFVVSPCAVGDIPGGGGSYGHSLIVDPWGRVLADGGDGRGVIMAEINLDLVAETEARIPSLMNDQDFSDLKIEGVAR